MVDGLPRHSHYGEALALDIELAREAPPPTGKSANRPTMRDWSPEYELLAAVFDRMNAFIQTQAEKPLNLKPWPVPLTAAEIVRAEQRQATLARLQRLITEGQERYRQLHNGTQEGE